MNPSPAPHDISQITDYLYISAWPRGEHGDQIRALDVRLILSMHWRRPSKTLGHTPVRLLWLPTIESPLTPMPMFVLKRGVEAALPVIADGIIRKQERLNPNRQNQGVLPKRLKNSRKVGTHWKVWANA